jgi:hypothetical protein
MARTGQILSDEELYLRLRQVITDMPDLKVDRISPDLARWFGEASFLVEECGDAPDMIALRTQIDSFGTMLSRAYDAIPIILYRALARAEARAPSSAHGTFIAAGKPFDALAAVSKLFSEAQADVLIVDAYADANLLDTFLVAVPERVPIRVLADAKALKPTLKPAVEAWKKQFGPARPLEARKAPKGSLHDRLILIDRTDVWLLGQSFNQLATRSNTYLSKADPELARMKIDAYDQIWGASAPIS